MLRGQASLQELIGRSYMARKKPASKNKPKADSGDTVTKLPAQQADASKTVTEQQLPALQPGEVYCPVCSLPVLERVMNSHLGTSS